MYKIIGANQVEYGPITAEQVRQWIAEGRVNAQTSAQAVGETAWRPISTFPEFAASFPGTAVPPGQPPPSGWTPPPLSATTAASPMAPEAGRANALQLVSGPAIGLIITGALGIAMALFSIVWTLLGFAAGNMQQLQSMHMGGQNEQLMRMIESMNNGPVAIIENLVSIALSIFIIYGAMKMKKLESHGLSMAVSILALIPCCVCCCVGIPVGIWSLIVLNKPEVRSYFT